MDQDQDKPPRRKIRYHPKAPPPSRKPKVSATTPRPERSEQKTEDTEAQAQRLVRQFNEANARRKPKVEKNFKPAASGQVVFGPGESSSPSIKTYGTRREVCSTKGTDSEIKDLTSDEEQIVSLAPSTAREDGTAPYSADASARKVKGDYKEAWDYSNTCYPTILPWRKPFSGNPEVLDEAEFGEATRNVEYDENTINTASDLGLLEECQRGKMLFFQLPNKLPLDKQSASTKGKQKAESSKPPERIDDPEDFNLSKLPGGYMGKMLVYKSGAVKLKLGDALFDVSSGSDCSCAQKVVAIDNKDKTCCDLGELDKRAIVTPDIDSILKP